MNLSCFGPPKAQADIAAMLKPDQDDKNASPNELVTYARPIGFLIYLAAMLALGLDEARTLPKLVLRRLTR